MLRLLWLSGLVIVLDQLTKFWIMARFDEYEVLVVWPVFNLTLVYNTGAAFSFLSDAGGWQRWFFIGLASVVSLAMVRRRSLSPCADWRCVKSRYGNGSASCARKFLPGS